MKAWLNYLGTQVACIRPVSRQRPKYRVKQAIRAAYATGRNQARMIGGREGGAPCTLPDSLPWVPEDLVVSNTVYTGMEGVDRGRMESPWLKRKMDPFPDVVFLAYSSI